MRVQISLSEAKSHLLRWVLLGLAAFLFQHHSWAQQLAAISQRDPGLPSNDLVYQGRILRTDEAHRLMQSGVNLSLLDPTVSAIWSPTSTNASDEVGIATDEMVDFQGALLSASGMFRFNVRAGSKTAIVHLDKTLHTLILRKNILRLLGYKIPAIKWLSGLKIRFSSLEEMNNFLDSQIPRATLGASSRWLKYKDEGTLTVHLQDIAVSVPSSSDHYNVAMGVPPQNLTSRTLRALIVVYAWLDLGESVNKFEWTVGRVQDGNILLPHFTRAIFPTTMDDALWVLRKLQALSTGQIEAALSASHFPNEVAQLLRHKLVARRDSLFRTFGLTHQAQPVELNLTIAPHLREGKITKEDWSGYASRFAHGDPETPFSDYHWYALAKLQALTLDNLVLRASNELSAFNPVESRIGFLRDQFERGLHHFVETGEFLAFPVGTWFSPIVDGSIIASRDVVMGNYLGTDNLVQLADSIGWTIDIGGHVGIENIPYVPTAYVRGSAQLTKTWSHLKPLLSLKDVFRERYRNIVVPLLKWQLTKDLDLLHQLGRSQNGELDWDISKDESELSRIINHINQHLGVGESILYSEKINPRVSGAVSTQALMGMPVAAKLGASAGSVDIRRVQIYRKSEKTIQIYDDYGNGKSWSIDLTLDYLIPIIRLGWRRQKGEYSIKLFEVDINPEVSENPKIFDAAHALSTFLQTGSSELLSAVQKPHVVEAKYRDHSPQLALLFWRFRGLNSITDFNVTSRQNLTGRYVLISRESQTGLNWEAFVKDIINYTFERLAVDVNWAVPVFQNPAQTIGGMGKTTQVRYEARVNEAGAYDESFLKLTKKWEGWSVSTGKVKDYMREVNSKIGTTLFDENTLNNIDKLKLFEIAVNFNLYEQGIQRLLAVTADRLISLENRYENRDQKTCDESRIRQRRLSDGRRIESCGTLNQVIGQHRNCRRLIDENSSPESIAKCATELYQHAYDDLDYADFIQAVGEENVFVHASINGFRDGDEILNDTILSNTQGRVSSRFWNGPIDKVQQILGIQAGELNGYWLRDKL